MEPRIDARRHAQEAQKAMYALEKYLAESGLDHRLTHLMKMRASQINGCAYCIDMHSKDARALGETEQRLYELDAWRETPFYTAVRGDDHQRLESARHRSASGARSLPPGNFDSRHRVLRGDFTGRQPRPALPGLFWPGLKA
jgi:AhpD family alkylhydroperoxidase